MPAYSVTSVMSDSAAPRTVACQAPLSMRFPRQENWSGFPFPPPGDPPDPGIEVASPALQVDSLPLSHQGCPRYKMAIENYPLSRENLVKGKELLQVELQQQISRRKTRPYLR